jgi:ABC-type antimicrobial peptide transport system ATPase subunit
MGIQGERQDVGKCAGINRPVAVEARVGFTRTVAGTIMLMGEGQIVERAPPSEILSYPKSERSNLYLEPDRRALTLTTICACACRSGSHFLSA